MNKNPNTDALLKARQQKTAECLDAVAKIIQKMHDEGIVLTKAEICEQAGVAKNYFSRHPELLRAYNEASGVKTHEKKIMQNGESKDAIIASLKHANKVLNSKYEKLEKKCLDSLKYKEMYEKEVEKVKRLEEQLNNLYANLDLDT